MTDSLNIQKYMEEYDKIAVCNFHAVNEMHTLRNEVGRTHKWLVHAKFLAYLAVFSRFVCTAHHLVYSAHQLEEIQHTSYNQVCTNHHSLSGSSTLLIQVCTSHYPRTGLGSVCVEAPLCCSQIHFVSRFENAFQRCGRFSRPRRGARLAICCRIF